MDFPLLSVIVLLPAVGGLIVLALPRRRGELVLPVALALSLLTLAAACRLLASFEVGAGRLPVRGAGHLVRALGGLLPPGGGRHLALDGAADRLPLPHRPAGQHLHHPPGEGLLRLDAVPGGGDPGGLRRPRPPGVLRLLGSDARPDVLHHRDVGRGAAALRRLEVLPVHRPGLGPDAGRHPGPGPARRRPVGPAHLRLRGTARGGPGPGGPVLALRRLRPVVRHQGAAVPPAHLAPRRPRRGPHRRFGDPGRGAAEDGGLRPDPLQPDPLPRGQRGPGAAAWPCWR